MGHEWNNSFNPYYEGTEGWTKKQGWAEIMEAVEMGELDTVEANRLLSELKVDWEGKSLGK